MNRLSLVLAGCCVAIASAQPQQKPGPAQLLIVSNRAGSANIYLINADGKKAKDLTNNPSENSYPAWSPDGKRIAFASTRSGNMNVHVMNADGTNVRQLTTGNDVCRGPTWSADGRKIAYCRLVDGASKIYALDVDKPENAAPLGDGDGYDPAYAPDGKTLSFTSLRRGDGFRLYIMDADGTHTRELTNTANPWGFVYPAWSPDNRKIAFAERADAGLEIFVANANGQGAQRITKLSGLTAYPTWSPDGKQIAFYHSDDNRTGSYIIADADGGNQRVLLKDEAHIEGGRPAWRPR